MYVSSIVSRRVQYFVVLVVLWWCSLSVGAGLDGHIRAKRLHGCRPHGAVFAADAARCPDSEGLLLIPEPSPEGGGDEPGGKQCPMFRGGGGWVV